MTPRTAEHPGTEELAEQSAAGSPGPREPVFYVYLRRHGRVLLLLGPYRTLDDADVNVARAVDAACRRDWRAYWDQTGVLRAVRKPGLEAPPGVLNGSIGLWPVSR